MSFFSILEKYFKQVPNVILTRRVAFHDSKYGPAMQHTWPFLTIKNNESWIEKYVENSLRDEPVGRT